MLKGKVTIQQQEVEGKYKFTDVKSCMSIGFLDTFQEEANMIAFTAIALILETYPENADYLQVFFYEYSDKNRIKFFCVNDIDHITFLLPSER